MYQGPLAYASDDWGSPLDRVAEVGDYTCHVGRLLRVTQVIDHEPETHPDSPIRNDLAAREWVTEGGSRWAGLPCAVDGSDDDIIPLEVS